MNKLIMTVLITAVAGLALNSIADTQVESKNIANARGNTEISKEVKPPLLHPVENTDIKQQRDYPMQPPLVPHKTDNYQVDKQANKCLSCHSRRRTEESQAPMVSVTHYMDRDGNFLADVSPRRYFCNQCHVTQTNAKPLLTNQFIDVDTILQKTLKKAEH